VKAWRGARGPRGSGARAFTLLELILVMMILALSAMMAVPMLAPFARGRKVTDTAGQLLALTKFAQDMAMSEGKSVRLEIDPGQGVFALTAEKEGAYAPVESGLARSFSVGDGVTIAWEGMSDAATQGYVQFDSDGGHDVATVRVTGSDGKSLFVGSSGPTEGYRISSEGGSL
jgi:prepilin-type N-terminal cleavage/methylation domain-containing protein